MSDIRFINPDALQKPPGYTHVVEATAPARLVYIAGQLGVDREGKRQQRLPPAGGADLREPEEPRWRRSGRSSSTS